MAILPARNRLVLDRQTIAGYEYLRSVLSVDADGNPIAWVEGGNLPEMIPATSSLTDAIMWKRILQPQRFDAGFPIYIGIPDGCNFQRRDEHVELLCRVENSDA